MFRFSLKWILAAMVYAAIAAAAFSQETWVYADILCAVSLLALGYAVVLIIYARGERQAAAAGFAVFMILLAACIMMAPQSVPTLRILLATGIGQPTAVQAPVTPYYPVPATATLSSSGTVITGNQSFTPSSSTWALTPAPVLAYNPFPQIDVTPKLRAFNAIATLTIGLLGCLLGVLAFRRARRTDAIVSTPDARIQEVSSNRTP